MPGDRKSKKNPQNNRRPLQAEHTQPLGSLNRYAAAGDEPLETTSRLTLQEPFSLQRSIVKGLVRREINAKEAFTIRDGSGHYFRASLKELHQDTGLALPYELMAHSPEPTIAITLACAVLGRQRMLFVMQKATELGVSEIAPLITDHSVPVEGLEHEKAGAWAGQILRAARQCRRASLPALHAPTTIDAFLTSPGFTSADACIVLDDRSAGTPAPTTPIRRVVLLVGPEGGFSDAERSKLDGKARPWLLGGRILRAETAVLAGLTAVHMTWGDFAGSTS